MSVKASWFQIGLSNTANLNFHWRNLLDGVLRLTRGNAGVPIADIMLVKADNSVEFPGNVASGVLGAGQTWQNMTASRFSGTTYTNTTGRPILVHEGITGGAITAVCNGVTVVYKGFHAAFVVPNGGTYSIVGQDLVNAVWSELR